MARHVRTARVLLGVSLCLTAIIGLLIYESFQCNFEDGLKLYRLPGGKVVKKFDPGQTTKSFSALSPKCEYEMGKLACPDVRHLGETLLRQTQLSTVRMLAAFDKICRKHGIKYWMWRGALLGTVRHKGFIPWDNELDIGIMKSDYDKFRLFSHELPTDIFLQNASSDKAFGRQKLANLAKLRDQNSCFGSCIRSGCKFHDGLMVDIFRFEDDIDFHATKLDVFPLKEAEFEGFLVYIPNNHMKILSHRFGSNYLEIPKGKNRCPPGQIIGLPWISCQELGSMNATEKNLHIYSTSISKVKSIAWYF